MRQTSSTKLWEDVQCYDEQSNTTLFHSMKQDIPWENASAQPSAVPKNPSKTMYDC